MKAMLGCLFILFFGGIFFLFGITRFIYQSLFGSRKGFQRPGWGSTRSSNRTSGTYSSSQNSRSEYTAGNAHHEYMHGNSRQKRREKIFEKNEGEYVDFEEV